MSYGIRIAVPAGYEGLTPDLRLGYSSGAGSSIAGLGWSLPLPSIERMTARGLPRYAQADVFAANGGDELVRVAGSDIYRARYEGGFVRYRWIDEDDAGRAGYWTAEYPDGRIGYFGADANGVLATDARVEGPDGVFRYHLSELRDALGHRVTFEYTKDGALSHPSRIAYAFEGDTPRYEILFSYTERPDEISDGKPGFEVRCTRRLVSVEVRVRGEQLRRYALAYDPDSPGLSRLAAVRQYGLDDQGPYPIAFQLGYSGGLGEACDAGMCNSPELVQLAGAVDFDFRAGTAELVDLNADALPDIVDTAGDRHRIFINVLDDEGQRIAEGYESETGAEPLASRHVQLFDVDGDGFADLVNAETQSVLYNRGGGDWLAPRIVDALRLPDFATDADARFLDFDNDKRIDVIHSDGTNTWYHRNDGGGAFSLDEDVPALGAGFTEDALQLADMNGDGMQDIVQVADGIVSFRMSLGHGRFADWVAMERAPPAPEGELRLWDLNGDSLADAVHIAADTVTFALNQSGRTFEAAPTELSASDSLPFPELTAEVTVRFADMNGSGSTDIVWIEDDGSISYLELFPNRPNLLTRIDNGIGKVIEVSYGSSAAHMAQDGGPSAWEHRLPSPMLTVDAIVTYDTLSSVRQEQLFRYHNGYWDGEEQQFRGFIAVEVLTPGDAHAQDGEARYTFDVGQTDRYRKALLLEQSTLSDGEPLSTVENHYEDCEVGGIEEAPAVPVRFVCKTSTRQIVKERLLESDWVTIDESYDYDGYGNRVEVIKHGVTSIGDGGCGACDRDDDAFGAPCGGQCLGDESFETTSYVSLEDAGGRWILSKPARKRSSGRADQVGAAEERYYYDGEAFEGLPLGELSEGLVTRVEARARAEDDHYVQGQRLRRDANGAVVEALDANGHRRRYAYDEASLLLLSESIVFDDPGHEPYELRMEVEHHPVLEAVSQSSAWRRVEDGEAVTPARETAYNYDAFGRLNAVARPGDSLSEPTERYRYDLADPVSRIVRDVRSQSGAAPDIQEIQCFDGLGRSTQTRTRIAKDAYQVSGFVRFSALGKEARSHQPYQSSRDRCDREAPDGVPAQELTHDASGRPLTVTHPDEDELGSASITETRYEPLRVLAFDEEDTAAASAHADTPLITELDGLGRTVGYERLLAPTDGARIDLIYDGLGKLRGYRDAAGNEKIQERDLLGRVLEVLDPDSGRTRFEYDDGGNMLARTDARGLTTAYRYDEADRILGEWSAADEEATRIDYLYDEAPSGCDDCTHVAGMVAEVRYPLSGGEVGADRFGYDARGRSVYYARELEGETFEFGTEHDNADRVVARRYPGGHELRYRSDAAGRLIAIPGYVSSIAYDERGLRQRMSFGNGAATELSYDERLRLRALETSTRDGETLQAYRYQRDRVGNILRLEDEAAVEGLPSSSAEYEYDAWYRVIAAELDPGRDDAERIELAYDAIDNILSKVSDRGEESADHVGTYEYDDERPHAAMRAGAIELEYDAAGNLTRRADDGFEWDYAGRLVRATRDDETIAQLTYGASRDRIKKVENGQTTYYIAPDFEVRDGVPTLYVRVDNQPVAKIELDDPAPLLPDLAPAELEGLEVQPAPDGVITAGDAWIAAAIEAEIFHGEAVEKPPNVEALLAASARRLAGGEETRVTYLHGDHVQSTVATTDADGAIASRTTYYPFGQIRSSQGGLEDYTFTGKERDRATELSYHGLRYLATNSGRWASPDPAFLRIEDGALESLPEAANPYAYALNRPQALIDPGGDIAFIPVIMGAIWVADKAYAAYEAYQDYKAIKSGETTVGEVAERRIKEAVVDVVVGRIGGTLVRKAGDAVVSRIARQAPEVPRVDTKALVKAADVPASAVPTPTAGQKVYRVYGGDSKPGGASWTPDKPSGDFRNAAGLPSGGPSGVNNSGRFVIEGTLQDPSAVVKTRKALPLDGNTGGANEYIIPNPIESGAVRVDNVSGVNPEF